MRKVLIGLGNPGTKYLKNRHNVGHMFIDFLKDSGPGQNDASVILTNVRILKTDCFMNESGKFVRKHLGDLGPTPLKLRGVKDLGPHSAEASRGKDLYIAHDDLDLKLGTFKIQFGVGPKVHNGITSIEQELGTKDFWRIRIGIDNRTDSGRGQNDEGAKYVLQDFMKEELLILEEVFKEILDALRLPTDRHGLPE